jgi:hypothetical protein
MDNRGRTPAFVWVAVLATLLGYEAWAILFGGYEYTLTYPVREMIDRNPWTASVLSAFLAWLGVHFIVERRRKGR